MGDVHYLAAGRTQRVNGAREALVAMSSANGKQVDVFLGRLWAAGFKIVPIEEPESANVVDYPCDVEPPQ